VLREGEKVISYANAIYCTGMNMTTGKDSNSTNNLSLFQKQQAFYFDGIRYSLGMIQMANDRLNEALYSLTTREWEKEYLSVSTASVMLDTWSIIDSVHRLRNLIMQAPGIKQKSPELRIFYDKTKGVEYLRNTIQHLRNEAKNFITKNLPSLGILTWVVLHKQNDKSASLFSLVAGTIYPNIVYPIVNPLGKRIQSPVDHITIILGNYSICVSDVVEQVDQVKSWMEQTLEKKLEAEPALIIRAELTFGEKGSTQAVSNYNKTIEPKHSYPEALNSRGFTYSKLGKYDKAIADYNKALELRHDYPEALNNRGILYNTLGKYNEALADYNHALELKPDYVDVLNNRGNVYLKLKKYKEALADYNKALEINPNLPDVLHNRGLTYSESGKYDKAVADYSKALKLKPDYVDALINRGITYHKSKKYDKALADYNKILELKPDYINAFNNRGNVYLDLKRYDEALSDYKRALELKPDYPPTLYILALLFAAQGKIDNTISYLEKAINKDMNIKALARKEKYFDNIRNDPRFKKLIGE